jgi:glutamate-ammonia-ligase adenylyltransferase
VILKKNYRLSQEFINKLVDQTAGFIAPDLFEEIIRSFESEISSYFFSFNSESNLLRILLSTYDKITLLSECIKYPIYIEILVSVAVNSNYLTDILVRNPEYFYWVANPSTLDYKLDTPKFASLVTNAISSFQSFKSKVNSLRGLKRKETLRIGVKDILHKENLIEITEELTALSKAIVAQLFELCYNEILNKHSLKKPNRKFCLIALGKLGGHELNYSSDIDLIIMYDKNLLFTKSKTYNEILTEATYLFIESASSITSSGYVYRIDFRLRPDGKTSPLCRELREYLDYYESRGEDWERQMLIKMDFIAGSRSLYESFSSYMQHFIYPLSFSTSPLEQIRKLKAEIEKKLDDKENIKLIPGGIRDIEFSAQALQLLNGGRNHLLRTPNTIEAIKNLQLVNLLSESEAKNLLSSYILYRRIEHYLQLMNDSQTHTIPQEGELLHRLSFFLGYKNSVEFRHAVSENRKSVLKIYNSIIGIKYGSGKKDDRITKIKFRNKTRAFDNLQFLLKGKGLSGQKQFDKNSTNNFHKIEPSLIKYLEHSYDPDKVLQNFVRVIRGASFPSIWYKEFENNKFFNLFLQLCEFSQMSIDLFAENDDLREYFLTKKVFENISIKDFAYVKASEQHFTTKKILLAECVQYSSGLTTSIKVLQTFKKYFNQVIASTAGKILNPVINDSEYAIAALGSLGAGEMTFASDIDLIFIVDNLNRHPEIQNNFQTFFLKLKENFKPFGLDCRLRPEGKSSLLTWDLHSYKDYILKRAKTWELQTFCKLNFVAGNKNIISGLLKTIKLKIDCLEEKSLKLDISDMRNKLTPYYSTSMANSFNIKKSSGGITDIEFIIQFILLSNKKYYSKYKGKRADQIILSLIKSDNKYHELANLKDNFLFLKDLELTNQVIFSSTSSTIVLNEEKISILSRRMNFSTEDEFKKYLSKIIKFDHSIFEKYFK